MRYSRMFHSLWRQFFTPRAYRRETLLWGLLLFEDLHESSVILPVCLVIVCCVIVCCVIVNCSCWKCLYDPKFLLIKHEASKGFFHRLATTWTPKIVTILMKKLIFSKIFGIYFFMHLKFEYYPMEINSACYWIC